MCGRAAAGPDIDLFGDLFRDLQCDVFLHRAWYNSRLALSGKAF